MADLEREERRMWDDLRREWEYVDKIHVSQEEFEKLKDVRLSSEEVSPVLEALFRPEKRMFLEDIAFVVTQKEELKRIIHLKYLQDDNASLTVYDGEGRLFGKIEIEVNGDDVSVRPDRNIPIGLKYFERYAKSQPLPSGFFDVKKQVELMQQAVIRRMFPRLEEVVYFVLAAIHHVLNTVEVRKIIPVVPTDPNEPSENKRSSYSPSSNTVYRYPKKLHKIIYEGRRVSRPAQKRTFIQHVSTWKVRGHYRTYANGKRVWVKPHVKGRKSEKFRPLGTEYRL